MSEEASTYLRAGAATEGSSRRGSLRLIVISMRPHQWVKNVFIFAPLLFGRKLTDVSALVSALVAFCVFCLLSSALYMINDCVDAEEDRAHPDKLGRPISSGELSISAALLSAVVLLTIGLILASQLGMGFLIIAGGYFLLILAYCLTLKRLIVLDCLVIAAGFVLRVVGGAVAVSVVPTHWLIACAFLLALFLAFSKRRQELLVLANAAAGHRKVLGQYSIPYLEQVNTILVGASVVCYALYTVAPETIERFGTDALIYGTVFVIYGMFRYLALIGQRENGGNPSKMLLKDRPLLMTVVAWALYNTTIIYYSHLGELLMPYIWVPK